MSEFQKPAQIANPPAPSGTPNYRMPSDATLKHAVKLAIVDDKPIMLDYCEK